MNRKELIQACCDKFAAHKPESWLGWTNGELLAALEGEDWGIAVRLRAERTQTPAAAAPAAAPAAGGTLEDIIAARVAGMIQVDAPSLDEDRVRAIANDVADTVFTAAWQAAADDVKSKAEAIESKIDVMASKVIDALQTATPTTIRRVATAIDILDADGVPADADRDMYLFLRRHASPGMALCPVQISGPAGLGKTYTARLFGRSEGFDLVVEIGGFAGMESIDLLGRASLRNGSEVWVDGPMAQAFRAAARGEKVLLIIDEILRIPARERSLMLTALTPDHGMLRLTTGRIIDVDDTGTGTVEVIEAPAENVAIVSTTNVGADYFVDADDPAMKERWKVYLIRDAVKTVEKVISGIAKAKGWGDDDADAVAAQCAGLYEQLTNLKTASQLAHAPSLRTLARAVTLAPHHAGVADMLIEESVHWPDTGLDGFPVPEQAEDVVNRIRALVVARTGD